ncbi:hypothetical protein PLICRDRAFT_227925 [Plicaturopsis crispa FD-325 SS-3]|nr:hypothetical protein PLICRDRAFT_227925 [Plicaturopsis crispa FD-325 SS-3]
MTQVQGRSDTHHGDGDQRPPPHPDLDWCALPYPTSYPPTAANLTSSSRLPSSRPFTAHSIREDVHSLMSPTYKVLGLLRESLASGAQRELAGRLWATAWTPAPWVLARNVCDRALKAWRAQPPDADDISR